MTSDEKQALRQKAKRTRDSIAKSDDPNDAAALAIAGARSDVLALTRGQAPVISAYIAIGSEIDPGRLIARLAESGAIIALPVMTAKDMPLEFRTWVPGSPLVERMWGIREPGVNCPVVEPDVLLVPLLLIDGSGNRLGYGGGFYDRTLSKLRATKKIVAIGLAHDIQRVDAVPHDDYDQPLDYILTPSGLCPVSPGSVSSTGSS